MSADTQLTPEVERFLSEGTRTAMLAYTATDGRPLVAPVWFIVDNGDIVLMTGKTSAKGRALARDARATLCVDEPHPPFGFVQIQGTATIFEDHAELLDIATRAGGRYMGPDRADEFGRRNGVPGELVVRIHPTKVTAAFDIVE